MTQRASRVSWRKQGGFTIVELLIVVVVIAILAAIIIVAYNGIQQQARDSALQSEVRQNVVALVAYDAEHGSYPNSCADAHVQAGATRTLYCRITPNQKDFCITISEGNTSFSATSTKRTVASGSCEGYILVPGNQALGTSDFWVMKYEAKRGDSDKAVSTPNGTPYVQISQVNAKARSADACNGCHLITEKEWMTLAGNILSVPNNWSSGVVGTGYVFLGHTDIAPDTPLAAGDDSDGYSGTGNAAGQSTTTNSLPGNSQRRTLMLSNGEVVWDISGNVNEWIDATIAAGQMPGLNADTTFQSKDWNNASMQWGALPTYSRPSALASTPGLGAINSWNATNGIGTLYSYKSYSVKDLTYRRGGSWNNSGYPWGGNGVLRLDIAASSDLETSYVGFRVAR